MVLSVSLVFCLHFLSLPLSTTVSFPIDLPLTVFSSRHPHLSPDAFRRLLTRLRQIHALSFLPRKVRFFSTKQQTNHKSPPKTDPRRPFHRKKSLPSPIYIYTPMNYPSGHPSPTSPRPLSATPLLFQLQPKWNTRRRIRCYPYS